MKRIYLLIVLLFTAIAAGAQIKVSGGPYLQNVTEDSFTVIWTTTGPAVGWIEVAPDDGTHFYNSDRPKYYDLRGMGRKPIGTLHKSYSKRTEARNHISLQGNVPGRALAGEQGQNRL